MRICVFQGTGGVLAGVCLPVPPVNWSILTDMDGEEKKASMEGRRKGRVKEQMSGLVGGYWSHGCGKCSLSGVSSETVQ